MAWTKPTFYFTLLLLVITTFTMLSSIGDDVINSDRINVDGDNLDYIAQLKGISTDSGFENISEENAADSNSKSILDSDDDQQVSAANDFLSTLFIKKERAAEPTNFFKLAYNILPNLILSLGLPISDFKFLINILSLILFIAVLSMVWTKYIRT